MKKLKGDKIVMGYMKHGSQTDLTFEHPDTPDPITQPLYCCPVWHS